MAIINVDDAYVLNETGAQVDKVTGLFTKDESTTSGEKSQARYNIAAGGSNRNLLDNAYFVGGGSQLGDGVMPINQRGQTSYSGSGYALDRYIVETYVTATLQATGIRVQTTALYVGLTQRVPVYRIKAGETYTISIIVDGTLYSASFVADGSGDWLSALYIDGLDWYIPMRYTSNYWEIKVINSRGNIDHIVSAVKLELGTVSTLANDPPPDFGEELRKCQRYLWVENIGANTPIASGIAFNTSSVFDFITPVPMRSGATIQITFNVTPYISYGTNNLALAGGGSTLTSGKNGNHLRVQIGHQNNGDLGGLTEVHLLCGTDTVMTVSCEL
ncbi:MAG: hypothetical protein K5707_08385 [Clostridia bacterium]|nr:hypothetical protein [Clostridia bacterium]